MPTSGKLSEQKILTICIVIVAIGLICWRENAHVLEKRSLKAQYEAELNEQDLRSSKEIACLESEKEMEAEQAEREKDQALQELRKLKDLEIRRITAQKDREIERLTANKDRKIIELEQALATYIQTEEAERAVFNAYKTAISSVLAQDDHIADITSDTSEIVGKMRLIDLTACPPNFKNAYRIHSNAWKAKAEAERVILQLRPVVEEQKRNQIWPADMPRPEVPYEDELERAVLDYRQASRDIQTTFQSLLAIADYYRIDTTPYQ